MFLLIAIWMSGLEEKKKKENKITYIIYTPKI